MQTLTQDLRYAVRSLVANPGFAGIAILMLALGIGANSTIFSWVNAVLLNPLPGSARTSELVQFTYLVKGDVLPSFSYPDYQDITRAARQVSGIAGHDDLAVGVVIDREAERAWVELVTANFFDVLGAPVVLGRGFSKEDDTPGTAAAVVLSNAYWQRRFNGDPSVIGRQVRINAQPFTIVGVAGPGFFGAVSGLSYDMWLPLGTQPIVMPGGNRLEARGSRWLALIGRLSPGATREQVRAELDSILDGMRTAFASQSRYIDHRAAVFPMDNSPDGGIAVLRPVLLILTAVAAVVLLITCANLAGLLLARASSRQREIAIRLSMGAGRRRIVQQLLVEGAVLAGLGAAASLVALRWTSGLLIGFAPPSELPIHLAVSVDATVVWFTAAVAIGTVLLFALAPAAQAAPADVATTLRDSGSAGRAFGRHRLRRALVAAQVALSISLLVGAGLCLRSLNHAARMTPGFQAEGVVVGWLDLFSAGYTAEEGRGFYARMLERVRALPGVESVTVSRRIPLGFIGGSFSDVTVEGHAKSENDPQGVGLNYVGPDYAATLKIPLVAGRDLSADDRFDRPRVALVSEAMARIFWKDRDPIGGRFMFGSPRPDQEPQWMTVVGVIKDIKQRTLTERAQPNVLIPILQFYAPTSVLNVRTASGLESISGPIQQAMRELDLARAVLQREPVVRSRQGRDVPAEAGRRPARGLWRAGAGARRHRQLRRAVVPRRPAPEGDRHSPRRWRDARGCVPADRGQRREGDRRRARRRPAALNRRRHRPREPADRHRADRSGHLCRCDRRAVAGGGSGVPDAGATRRRARSGDHTARGVIYRRQEGGKDQKAVFQNAFLKNQFF